MEQLKCLVDCTPEGIMMDYAKKNEFDAAFQIGNYIHFSPTIIVENFNWYYIKYF